jgi:hypothetical protein
MEVTELVFTVANVGADVVKETWFPYEVPSELEA